MVNPDQEAEAIRFGFADIAALELRKRQAVLDGREPPKHPKWLDPAPTPTDPPPEDPPQE